MKKRIACLLLTFVMLVSLIPAAAITASADGLAISEAGIKVIKDYMGFKKNAYQVGSEYRIGYGTPSVAGATITEANADSYLREALAYLDSVVNSSVSATLVQKRHDALVWYSYVEGTAWTSNSDFLSAINKGLTGSDLVDVMCGWNYFYANFPDDAAARGVITRRMAMANMYLNGVYSSANTGSFAYTVFDAGEGAFGGYAKKAVQIFDTNQVTPISAFNPENGSKQFLGWYSGNSLVTGVSSSTAGKTLTARWQDGSNKVPASYTLPAYVIYEAAGVEDYKTVNVYKDPAIPEKIDVVNRDAVVTVVAEKIVNGAKWLELATGGWVLLCPAGAVMPTIVPSTTVTITDDYVNIRYAPYVTAEKVGVAKRGETRTIVMTVQGDTWGYCSEGWIYLAYTDYNQKNVGEAGKPYLGTGTPGTIIGANQVNVRDNAGVYNNLVKTLPMGTAVTVYSQEKVNGVAWGRIDEGWVCMQYVRLSQPAAQQSTAPSNVGSGDIIVVTGTASLRARSGPGTQYSINEVLPVGTKLAVKQVLTEGGVSWALTNKGWVNMSYVSTESGASNGSSSSSAYGVDGTVVNCSNGVNIRGTAGTSGALVGVAAVGSRVRVTQMTEVNGHKWGKIDRGWVCMDYVKLDSAFVEPQKQQADDPSDNVVTSFVGYPAIARGNVKVFESASSDFKVVMTLSDGAEVYITDRVETGIITFGKVTIGSITGWVNLDDMLLKQVNAKVTAAKADAYEMPSTRSTFFASLNKGTYVTIGNKDGSGWELSEGALWGKATVHADNGYHSCWIKMTDVTMFKDNVMPTGITTLNGVGYLTGTINSDTVVYEDSNGNVTNIPTDYTLVSGHRVNIQARNYIPETGMTWAKVTVGATTGWINIENVVLDFVVQKTTADLPALDLHDNAVAPIPAGSKITIVNRDLGRDRNEINYGLSDWGMVYVNDNADTYLWVVLDEGKLVNVTEATPDDNSNPVVQSGVVMTGLAPVGLSVSEEAVYGSYELLKLNTASYVTVLNWKNVGGITWGKVKIGQIVGWVDVSQIDFSDVTGIVAVAELPVYNNPDKDSSVQVLRVSNKLIRNVANNLYFDGSILWGNVTVGEKEGWIDLSNILLSVPGSDTKPELVVATGRVNSLAALAYLGENPSLTQYADVQSLPKDTALTLLNFHVGDGRTLWKVDLADRDGWMDMDFIKLNPVIACVTAASARVFNDLYTINTYDETVLYTLYRNETITVYDFMMKDNRLYGMVDVGNATGWIILADENNNHLVSLTPGTTANPVNPTNPTNPANPTNPTQSTTPEVQGTDAYIVCSTVVNVRSQPDPTSDLVTTLANGTAIKITEQTTYIGKSWAHIQQGWVCMDYVKMGTAPVVPTPNNNNSTPSIMTTVPAGAIAVGYANQDLTVYSGAAFGYKTDTVIPKNSGVVIYENQLIGNSSWARTDKGWVILNYVTVTGVGVAGSGQAGTIARCGFAVNVRPNAGNTDCELGKIMITSTVMIHETTTAGSMQWGRTDLGWICMDYVVMANEAAPVPTPVPTPANPTVPTISTTPTAPSISGGLNEVG